MVGITDPRAGNLTLDFVHVQTDRLSYAQYARARWKHRSEGSEQYGLILDVSFRISDRSVLPKRNRVPMHDSYRNF